MSERNRYYIEVLGLSDIAIVSSKWSEEKHGLQNEDTVEEIVCRKEGKFRRMKFHWVWKVFRGSDCVLTEDKEISKEEYEELRRQTEGIVDTLEYRERLANRRKIIDELEDLTPLCPKCESQMVRREGPHGDFWGCSNYPKCKGSRRLVDSVKSRIQELNRELDSYKDL